MQLQLYEPSSTIVMTNEIGADPKNVFPCFAMKGSYLFSASGGRISIFSLETFEVNESYKVAYLCALKCVNFIIFCGTVSYLFCFIVI